MRLEIFWFVTWFFGLYYISLASNDKFIEGFPPDDNNLIIRVQDVDAKTTTSSTDTRRFTIIHLTTTTTTTTTLQATRSSLVFTSASAGGLIVANGTVVTAVDSANDTVSTSVTFASAPTIDTALDLGNVTSQLTFPLNATSFPIGALIPLTINGTASLAGVQFAECFKCQVNIYNSNGRIMPNSLFTYYIQNTDISPSVAVFNAYLLARRNVPMVVGPFYDIQFPPVEALFTTRNIPLASYGVGAVQFSNTTLYPTFYRVIPSDQTQARAMAQTFKIFGWNFVSALFTNDIYGQSGRAAFLNEAGRQRIKVTCSSTIIVNSTRGLQNFASCISQSEASVVLLWMGPQDAANAISFLNINSTINSRLTFIAPDGWSNIEDIQNFNDTTARTNNSFPLSFIEGTLGYQPIIGSLGQAKACLSVVNPSNTDYPEFNQVWQEGFKCVINGTNATPICPESIADRTTICRCRGNENFSDLPITPKVNYIMDAVTIFVQTLNNIIYNCGKIRGNFCNTTEITGSLINQVIPLLSFNGLTGAIAYNQTKPDRRRSFLDILQYNDKGMTHQVGFWNVTGPFISRQALHFKTYPAYPTSSLTPENTNFGVSFWTVIVPVLAGLLIFISIFFIILFILYRDHRVIRRSNLFYNLAILVGIILVLVAMIVWTFNQSTFTCTSKAIIQFIGIGLVSGAILAKCIRIFRVYAGMGHPAPVMTFLEFFIAFIIVFTIMLATGIVYITARGAPTDTIVQSVSDNTFLYIACIPGAMSFMNWVVGCFLAVNALILIFCALVLFLTRDLQSAYNETDYMFLTVLDFIVLLAALVPLYYTVGDRRGSSLQKFLLRSLAILFAVAVTLGLLFLTKWIAIRRSIRAKKKRSGAQGGAGASTTDRSGGSATATGATGASSMTAGTVQYTEMSTSDLGSSESEGEFTAAGGVGGRGGGQRPQFISENISRSDSNNRRSGGGPSLTIGSSRTGNY